MMIFNSYSFLLFFIAVYLLNWLVCRRKLLWQNALILVSSYAFYASWDWRFLFLIAFTSLISYVSGLLIEKKWHPRMVSSLNVILNLLVLGFFKYCNFFIDSLVSLLSLAGVHSDLHALNIILPVGISFYTFQALSYSIDVYNGKMEASHNPLRFFAFVSFFPSLLAGPIGRAKDMLPQYDSLRKFDYKAAVEGFSVVLYGLALKVLIADRLAVYVNAAYSAEKISACAAWLAVFFFAFQLYIDFHAYSLMARGVAKMLGFSLMVNFRRPYLSHSFKELWKRWHISLSSWFMDYVYIPLGGNRKGLARKNMNLMAVFLLSGLWHGASWNFVIWGALNGLFLILFDKAIKHTDRLKFFNPVVVFFCWSLSLVFFKAGTFSGACNFFTRLFCLTGTGVLGLHLKLPELIFSVVMIALLMAVEIFAERSEKPLEERVFNMPAWARVLAAAAVLIVIALLGRYGVGNESTFIYFQF